MVNIAKPWLILVLFVVKPWLIFVREAVSAKKNVPALLVVIIFLLVTIQLKSSII